MVSAGPRGHATPAVTDEIRNVVAFVNGHTAGRWRVAAALSGGTSGAFELARDDGDRVVLKTRPGRFAWWIERGKTTIDVLRAAGYPTPAYLEVGETDGGWTHWLMEHIAGRRMALTSEHDLELLLELMDQQAGLGPQTAQNWATYITDVVFNNGNGWAAQMRAASPAAAELLAALEIAVESCRDVRFPDDDAVIGDFGPHNVLVHGGKVSGVIDAESAGRGTRVYDLWSLLAHELPPAWRQRVMTKIQSLTDARGIAVLHAHHIIRPFDWTVATPNRAYVEASVAAGWERLDALRECLA